MSWQPLSDFLVSEIITELGANAVFNALTSAQQIQLINSATQKVSDLYVAKERTAYQADNLLQPASLGEVLGSPIVGIEENVGLSGVTVTFDSAFTTLLDATGDYYLGYQATKDGVDVGVAVTKAAGSVTFTPAETGVTIRYLVVGYTA